MDPPVYRASLFDDDEHESMPRSINPTSTKYPQRNRSFTHQPQPLHHQQTGSNLQNDIRRRTRSAIPSRDHHTRGPMFSSSSIKSKSMSCSTSITSNSGSRFDGDFRDTSRPSSANSSYSSTPLTRTRQHKQKSVLIQSHELLQKQQQQKQHDSAHQKGENQGDQAGSSERVKVAIRCRPHFEDELDAERASDVIPVEVIPGDGTTDSTVHGRIVLNEGPKKRSREFGYDFVFGPRATQEEVYETVAEPIVRDVLQGVNGTIFAYGQTGTGKTHTMGILKPVLELEDAGLIPRALNQVFAELEERDSKMKAMYPGSGEPTYSVTLTFVQLYIDMVQDLLSPVTGGSTKASLSIREDPDIGFYVEGLVACQVHTCQEALAVLNAGLENRSMASTLMNTSSSRSHTILSVNIEQFERFQAPGPRAGPQTATVHSKLLLVDLAGSERVRRTTSTGKRLAEARSINGSLSALGNVISALAEQKRHVRFRDSKLTKLLQGTLDGQSRAALIAAVSPAEADVSETLSTLMFASRCMHVVLSPQVSQPTSYADLCAHLQLKLSTLEMRFKEEAREAQMAHQREVQQLREEVAVLREQRAAEMAALEPNNPALARNLAPVAKQLEAILQSALQQSKQLAAHWIESSGSSTFSQHGKTNDAFETAKSDIEGVFSQEGWSHFIPPTLSASNSISVEVREEVNEELNQLLSLHAKKPISLELALAQGKEKGIPEADVYVRFISTGNAFLGDMYRSLDCAFNKLKKLHLDQMVEERCKEEEVVNWSHILKYLLSANTRLRQQVREGRKGNQQACVEPATKECSSPSDVLEEDRFNSLGGFSSLEDLQQPLSDGVVSTLPSRDTSESDEFSDKSSVVTEKSYKEKLHPTFADSSAPRKHLGYNTPQAGYSPLQCLQKSSQRTDPRFKLHTVESKEEVSIPFDDELVMSSDDEDREVSQLDLLLMKRRSTSLKS